MAFLGIRIPAEVARTFRNLDLPGDTVSESEYHITILMFEENWPIKEVAKAMEAALEVISETKPFLVSTKAVTCFPKREGHPYPVISLIDSKDLHELNSDLKKSFDKADVEYSKTFKDFKPHITLSYSDEEVKKIKLDPKVEFVVHEVVLWAGDNGDDRIFITFPLKGIEQKKNSYLLQKVDVFQKLSSKDPNSVLTSTQERRSTERSS